MSTKEDLEKRWNQPMTAPAAKMTKALKLQEQAACHTLAELIALGTRRGYSRPEAWARKIMSARS